MLPFVSSKACSIILIGGNWAFLLIKECQNCYRVIFLFWHDNIFAKLRTKRTTVTSFPRQNDAGLRARSMLFYDKISYW